MILMQLQDLNLRREGWVSNVTTTPLSQQVLNTEYCSCKTLNSTSLKYCYINQNDDQWYLCKCYSASK